MYCINKKLSYRGDNARQQSLRRSRSFKVTNFDTSRKPVCDFTLLNNTNLRPISHLFQSTADHWTIFRCRQGVRFNAFARGEPLNSRLLNLIQTSLTVRCKICFNILNRLGVDHECNGRTDRQNGLEPQRTLT